MISLLIPTRNRPSNVNRLVNSVIETVENIQTLEFLFYIDDDDQESIPAIVDVSEKVNVQAIQGNRLIGSQMYNELVKFSDGDIIMFGADDIIFKTPKWDTLVQKEFNKIEDKILFVYGEDGYQHGRIGTHGFIHKYWVELLGYVLPPKLASAYTDEWITELAERVGRKCYKPDLIIEHLHPATGKAPNDDTYSKRIEISGDIAIYYKSLEKDRIRDSNVLKSYIEIFS